MMNLARAVYALVHESAIPPKQIADAAGCGYGYLLKAADDQQPEVQFQARWVSPTTRASGNDALIKFLAEDCGGVFYRLNPAGSIDAETAKSLKEFAEYLTAVAEVRSDRTVTAPEFYRAKAQAHEAIAAILAHVEGLRISAGVGQ